MHGIELVHLGKTLGLEAGGLVCFGSVNRSRGKAMCQDSNTLRLLTIGPSPRAGRVGESTPQRWGSLEAHRIAAHGCVILKYHIGS